MSAQENHISLDGPMRRILAANQAQGESCPSPEIFAAYFEHSLDPEETERYDAHFASCPACRETLAGIARANAGATPLAHEQRESKWDWKQLRLWLIPAAAGAMALLIAVVLYQRSSTAPPPNAESASSRLAVPADNVAPKLEARVAPAPPPNSGAPPAQLQAVRKPTPVKKFAVRQPQPPAALNALTRNESSAAKRALDKEFDAAVVAAPPPPASTPQSAAAVSESVEVTEAAPITEPVPAVHAKASAALPQRGAVQNEMARATAGVSARSAAKAPDRLVVTSPDSSISWTVHTNHVQYAENRQPAPVQDFLPTNNPITAGSAPGGKVCWLVGQGGSVVLTTDGRLWLSASSPTTSDLSAVTAKSARVATVTATDGHMYTTTDGGQTWKSQN